MKFYDGPDFDGGWEREFGPGTYKCCSHFPGDQLSSLKVMPGCHADVWQHDPNSGWHAAFGPGSYDLAAFKAAGASDNDASSLKVTGRWNFFRKACCDTST